MCQRKAEILACDNVVRSSNYHNQILGDLFRGRCRPIGTDSLDAGHFGLGYTMAYVYFPKNTVERFFSRRGTVAARNLYAAS